ncbi:hemicentin-1-like [Mytilus trossulus]|uniref:hemicentin-1-like n=1 Tax=Mytilus trossulus TaxID=6551 RepID=UPI003004B11D
MVGAVGDHGEVGVVVSIPVLIHTGIDISTTHVALPMATVVTVGLTGVRFQRLPTRNAIMAHGVRGDLGKKLAVVLHHVRNVDHPSIRSRDIINTELVQVHVQEMGAVPVVDLLINTLNGGWSGWSFGNWGSCSASCKKCGTNTNPTQSLRRYRYCNNPSPACGGSSCPGSSSYVYSNKNCNTQYCKLNGGWSGWKSWGSWEKCSADCKTCGSSSNPYKTRRRYRVCNNPTPSCNGNSCPGSKYITSSTSCNTHYCKVNGGWSSWKPWGSWGSCSAVCKPCGSSTDPTKTRLRYRACNNPTPACNGQSCSGRLYISASKSCNTHYCKVNGGWGSWESWTKVTNCSAECKKEGSVSPTLTRTRKRLCNNPAPSCNGQSCSGSPSEKSVQDCNTQSCPIDGYWEWGNWGAWDECSKTCDSGSHKRIRYNKCIGPKYGGKPCSKKVTKTHTYHRGCNRNIPCPGM